MAEAREAARILTLISDAAHVVEQRRDGGVRLDVVLSQQAFDRFCVWDCARQEVEEDDPNENDIPQEGDAF